MNGRPSGVPRRPMYFGRDRLSDRCTELTDRKFAEWERQRPVPVGCPRSFSPLPGTSYLGTSNLSPVPDMSETVVLDNQ
jgi:hypothetical protein